MSNVLKTYGISNKWHLLSVLLLPLLIFLANPALALLVAMVAALLAGRGLGDWTATVSKYVLQIAIVLLGFKINMQELWVISRDYSALVSVYVIATLSVGLLLGRILGINSIINKLTTSGTAICGGTTVASLSPILQAKVDQTGLVMAMIFLLNAVAMFSFPFIGHWLDLSQSQFGLWSALAIHDTSSVLATAAIYGDEALQVATTVKLGRTLWLIPLLVVFSILTKQDSAHLRLPVFVLLFVMASILGSFVQLDSVFIKGLSWLSKSLLVVALFLIGSQIGLATIKEIRGKTLVHAFGLWLIAAPLTLFAILQLA